VTGQALDVSVHFEPIVQVRDATVTARELLLRPIGGGHLLERVDRSGIDRGWITRLALTTAGLVLEHSSVPVQVNVTPDDLAEPAFAEELLQRVPASALGSLVLEVTEDAPVFAGTLLDRTLATLRGLGVRFAIDDFGDGCAGLESIDAVRPEIIKVRLTHLHRGGEPTELARSLRRIASHRDASVVVEQVETSSDLRLVEQLGFPLAQGWYWDDAGRPTEDPDGQEDAPDPHG
jgi:EAL domain-containing protein (putative c-di-GMP-specific phosphodiesterase class I)